MHPLDANDKRPDESDVDYFTRKRKEAQQRTLDAAGVVVEDGRVYIIAPGLDNVVTTTQRTRLG